MLPANKKFYPVLEHPLDDAPRAGGQGEALARVIEWQPELSQLLDFYDADPREIAEEVGLLTSYDEIEDLEGVELGGHEWFEAAAGVAAVRRALEFVRKDPGSIRRAIYEPDVTPAGVIADLEAIERVLEMAHQQETRFYFALTP